MRFTPAHRSWLVCFSVTAVVGSGCAGMSQKWMTRSPVPATSVTAARASLTDSDAHDSALAAIDRQTEHAARKPALSVPSANTIPEDGSFVESAEQDSGSVQLASLSTETTESSGTVIAPEVEAGMSTVLEGLGTVPPAPAGGPIALSQVIDSIQRSYPLLEVAIYGRNVAAGEQLASEGAYDLKLKAATDNTPVGYYQTYRQHVGLEQDLYFGGQVFGGYRIGRGEFEPWYQERQTNQGGEFRAGMMIPLAQNRAIDPKRTELWKATYGRNAVEPAIQSQVIMFVYGGSLAYWDWVAAGRNLVYAEQLYDLAIARDQQLRTLVENGAQPEAALTDNQRLVASREIKRIDAERKLQQSAVKLSLFLRTAEGQPYVPSRDQLPEFPITLPVTREQEAADISAAITQRPELRELDFQRRIAEVDLAQAHNETQPALDATLWGAQDVGGFTSSKGDKQPLELQGSLNFSMPLQRRKAQGKIHATEGKIAQISAKRKFTADKITTEVQNATIALTLAYEAIQQARRSVVLNEEMQQFETVLLNNGASDLLRLNIRETQTFDARVAEAEALLRYFEAQAELRAAIGLDALDPQSQAVPAADLVVPIE